VRKLPPSAAQRDCLDLLAFLAALAATVILIAVSHVTAGELTSVPGALVVLFAVWNHGRTAPPKALGTDRRSVASTRFAPSFR
jgi:hypothetical protein